MKAFTPRGCIWRAFGGLGLVVGSVFCFLFVTTTVTFLVTRESFPPAWDTSNVEAVEDPSLHSKQRLKVWWNIHGSMDLSVNFTFVEVPGTAGVLIL